MVLAHRFLVLTVGLLATTSVARADITATFASMSATNVSINFNGSGSTTSAGAFTFNKITGSDAGLFGSSFLSFCVDLAQNVSQGTAYNFTVGTVGNLPEIQGSPSSATASLITEFWGRHYNAALTSNTNAAAFQLGIWELVYDSNTSAGVSLSSGKFKASGAVATTASSWLTGLSSGPTNSFATNFGDKQLVGLVSATHQDQIAMINAPVPAPAGLLLGGIGLGILALRRRKTR